MAARLAEKYDQEIAPQLMKSFGYKNRMAIPRLAKIVVDMGVGAATENKDRLDAAARELAIITGQKPLITKAKKSVAGFKVRQGNPVGCKVTLRRQRMYFDQLKGTWEISFSSLPAFPKRQRTTELSLPRKSPQLDGYAYAGPGSWAVQQRVDRNMRYNFRKQPICSPKASRRTFFP